MEAQGTVRDDRLMAEESGDPAGETVTVAQRAATFDSRIVAHCKPRSRASEQYRTLCSQLLELDYGSPPEVILITSPEPREGKSVTALNLGVSYLSRGETNVLVIDANLRDPRIHEFAGTATGPGLSECLAGEAKWSEIIQPTAHPGLSVMPVGDFACNPTEALSSTKLRALIRRSADEYDRVLIDAPPVVTFSDAAVIAPHVDGVLLVLKAGSTQPKAASQARFLLERVDARLLGSVITHLRPASQAG